jgi:hypothetical protein
MTNKAVLDEFLPFKCRCLMGHDFFVRAVRYYPYQYLRIRSSTMKTSHSYPKTRQMCNSVEYVLLRLHDKQSCPGWVLTFQVPLSHGYLCAQFGIHYPYQYLRIRSSTMKTIHSYPKVRQVSNSVEYVLPWLHDKQSCPWRVLTFQVPLPYGSCFFLCARFKYYPYQHLRIRSSTMKTIHSNPKATQMCNCV